MKSIHLTTAPFHGDVPKDHRATPVSRPNFVDLCRQGCTASEDGFELMLAVPIDTASSRESLTCFAVALMGAVEAHTLACVAR